MKTSNNKSCLPFIVLALLLACDFSSAIRSENSNETPIREARATRSETCPQGWPGDVSACRVVSQKVAQLAKSFKLLTYVAHGNSDTTNLAPCDFDALFNVLKKWRTRPNIATVFGADNNKRIFPPENARDQGRFRVDKQTFLNKKGRRFVSLQAQINGVRGVKSSVALANVQVSDGSTGEGLRFMDDSDFVDQSVTALMASCKQRAPAWVWQQIEGSRGIAGNDGRWNSSFGGPQFKP